MVEEWMLKDMLEFSTPPKPSQKPKAVKPRPKTPVLTVIDLIPTNGETDVTLEEEQEEEEEVVVQPVSSPPNNLKLSPVTTNPGTDRDCSPRTHIYNMADYLVLTPNDLKKSGIKIKNKTVQWVMDKVNDLQRRSRSNSQLSLHEKQHQKQESKVKTVSFDFDEIEKLKNSKSSGFEYQPNNRLELNSAFSSIPWCYHNTESRRNEHDLPDAVKTAIIPDQLYIRSVKHLQKGHHTGISRPGTGTTPNEMNLDEVGQLRRMPTPMLNEAVKEAVGLGLMSAYEAQTLMQWIERPVTPQATQLPGPETAQKQEIKPIIENSKITKVNTVGLCDPNVGFEPVEVTFVKPNPPPEKPVQGQVTPTCESETAPEEEEAVEEVTIEEEEEAVIDLPRDELRLDVKKSKQKPGYIARPCTAAER